YVSFDLSRGSAIKIKAGRFSPFWLPEETHNNILLAASLNLEPGVPGFKLHAVDHGACFSECPFSYLHKTPIIIQLCPALYNIPDSFIISIPRKWISSADQPFSLKVSTRRT